MPGTAKVFMTNRSQAVRLPKEYQFETDEVFIRKTNNTAEFERVSDLAIEDWTHPARRRKQVRA